MSTTESIVQTGVHTSSGYFKFIIHNKVHLYKHLLLSVLRSGQNSFFFY